MKHTDDLERKLRGFSTPDPPEDLLDRLLADIPEELPDAGGGAASPGAGRRYQWWMAAAAVLVLALTGVVTWKMGPVGPRDRGSTLIIVHDQRIPEAPPEQAGTLAPQQAPTEVPRRITAVPAAPSVAVQQPNEREGQPGVKTTHPPKPMPAAPGYPAPETMERAIIRATTAAQPPRHEGRKADSALRLDVIDEGRQPLPGATVILSSPDMQGTRSDVTDADGKADFELLKEGTYKVSVSLPGYQRKVYDKVPVAKDSRGRLNVKLPSAFKEEVLVTSQAPAVDVMSTTVGSSRAPAPRAGRHSASTSESMGKSSSGRTVAPRHNERRTQAYLPPKALEMNVSPRQRITALRRQAKELDRLGQTGEARRLRGQASQLEGALSPAGKDASHPIPSTGGTTEPNDQPYGDVFFDPTGVNPFVDTEDDRLSTFGLDVDTGSFTVTRRYLRDGHLPPPAAIRVEELVNAFDYGDPAPRRRDFNLVAEGAPNPFGNRERSYILRFAVTARQVDTAHRPPALLIFTVDISGSMARENRLGLVKRALTMLLDELRADDRVGLVVFGSTGRVLLEPTRDHEAIRAAIERLQPGGSTNAEEGLVLAYRMAGRFRDELEEEPGGRRPIVRVILCSDGVANVGRTGAGSILERIRREAGKGIQLTTVGFGMGNYNDTLMERLADTGDGRYAYVDDLDEARRIFVEELTGTLLTIAHDARSQVELNPRVVERWRLLGYENRDIADERFRDPTVDAGEVGAGQTVTALYEVKLRPRIPSHRIVATLRLRYRPTGEREFVEVERRLRARELARSWEEASPRLQLASLVAEFAEILKHSYWAKHDNLGDVLRRLRQLHGPLARRESVQELQDLVREALMAQRNKRYITKE